MGPTKQRTTRNSVLGLVLLLLVVVSSPAAEPRTWSDATGSFSVKATFKSQNKGKVTLVLENGQQVEIEFDKLSTADQNYVKAQSAANPFKPKSANPFTPKTGGDGKMPAPSGNSNPKWVVDDTGSFESRLEQVSSFAAQTIAQISAEGGWKIDPATLAGAEFVDNSGKPIKLPPKRDFFEKTRGMVFNPSLTHAVVGYTLEKRNEGNTTRLLLLELNSGKAVANVTTGGLLSPVALANDGTTVLMRRAEFGFGKADRLELWSIAGSAIKKGPAWYPYGSAKGGDRDVLLAQFLGDDQLVTASAGGRVTGWSLDPLKATWTCQSVKGCRPAVSPDGKHVVFSDGERIMLVDMNARKIVASRPAPDGAFPKFAFSPSGERFAVMTQGNGGFVWDSATGEQYREIETALLPSLGPPQSPIFATDDHVLFGEKYLVHLPSLIPLWSYTGAEAVRRAGDAVWYVAHESTRGPGVTFGAKLPLPPVKKALKQALSDPNFFVLKPGKAVQLKLDRLPDAKKREEIRKALTENLLQQEIRVDPKADVVLTASFNPPTDENLIYHGFGGRTSVDFKKISGQVEIKWHGKTLWKSGISNQPYFLSRKKGESVQEAVKRYEGPPYGAIAKVRLPKMLAKPSGNKDSRFLGTSKVTTTGIR